MKERLNRPCEPLQAQNPGLNAREYAKDSAQNSASLAERLRKFMRAHDLSRTQLASIIQTPTRTLDHYLDDGVAPPGSLGALLVVLERCGCARRAVGMLSKVKAAPRGRPFGRGNPWRFVGPGIRAMNTAKSGPAK